MKTRQLGKSTVSEVDIRAQADHIPDFIPPGVRFFQKEIAGHTHPQAFPIFNFIVALPVFFQWQIEIRLNSVNFPARVSHRSHRLSASQTEEKTARTVPAFSISLHDPGIFRGDEANSPECQRQTRYFRPAGGNESGDIVMVIQIRQATIRDIDLLTQWRMEVLHEVFAIPPAQSVTELEAEKRRYYQAELPRDGHIACFAYIGEEIVGCGGMCL